MSNLEEIRDYADCFLYKNEQDEEISLSYFKEKIKYLKELIININVLIERKE